MTRIEIFGPVGSGKSYCATQMARAGIPLRDAADCYTVVNRHVFLTPRKALQVEQWLRAHDYNVARRDAGKIVVTLKTRRPS